MTWVPTENRTGIQPIAVSSTTQNHQLGEIIRALDGTGVQGGGEFIYLEGVANTVVGMLVTYDPVAGTTTLVPSNTAQGNPLAVAMSANVASQFGWYQVAGAALIKKTAVKITPGSKLAISATAGRVFATSTAGKAVWNAISVGATVASATSTVTALIQRPFAEPIAAP